MADTTPRDAANQFWIIERCAQALEAAARGFCEVAPTGDETAASLADSYLMAANEVRLQIPAYALMKQRNLAAVKAWDKASAPPKLEEWEPLKYAPGALGAGSGASGVPALPEGQPLETIEWWAQAVRERGNDGMVALMLGEYAALRRAMVTEADQQAWASLSGAPVRDQPRHDNGEPAPEDNIAKSKRVLAAVDTYHERPDAMNRTALRQVIYTELEQAAIDGAASTNRRQAVHACEAVLLDLLEQVRKFCAEQGEADFETGAAEAMKRQIVGQEVTPGLQRQLDKVLAGYGVDGAAQQRQRQNRLADACEGELGCSPTRPVARRILAYVDGGTPGLIAEAAKLGEEAERTAGGKEDQRG